MMTTLNKLHWLVPILGIVACASVGPSRDLSSMRLKLSDGMSAAEVKSAIGSPDQVHETDGGTFVAYFYRSGKDELSVNFKNDKLVLVSLRKR